MLWNCYLPLSAVRENDHISKFGEIYRLHALCYNKKSEKQCIVLKIILFAADGIDTASECCYNNNNDTTSEYFAGVIMLW